MKEAYYRPGYILPVIVIAQFAGTSLWFAGNVVLPDLQKVLLLPPGALGSITSSVQLGFISGTLTFAILTIADRFSPSKVFLLCSLFGALLNLGPLIFQSFLPILVFRFVTGFFLAGIYPIGMKIASDWHEKGLGKALGYLVGALVLGTAFPHLIRNLTTGLPWKYILIATSAVAVLGGVVIWFIPDGPFRKVGARFNTGAILRLFQNVNFKRAAFGYFGHMWELYAFWAFVPFIILYHNSMTLDNLSSSMWSFIVIGVGALSCVSGGHVSLYLGSKRVAALALAISGLCCLLSPFIIGTALFLPVILIWGMAVVADSPQFSTLVAQTADREYIGTGLTVVNCIGFAITIASIQLVALFSTLVSPHYLFLILALGPAFGLFHLLKIPKH